jgi:hypothetical protein
MSRNEKLYLLFLTVLIVFMCFNWHFHSANRDHHAEREKHIMMQLNKFQKLREHNRPIQDNEEIVYEYDANKNKLSHEEQNPSKKKLSTKKSVKKENLPIVTAYFENFFEKTEHVKAQKKFTKKLKSETKAQERALEKEATKRIFSSFKQYEEFEGYDVVYKSIYSKNAVIDNNEKINKFPLLRAKYSNNQEKFQDLSIGSKLNKDELRQIFEILWRSKAFLVDLDSISSIKFANLSVDLEKDLPNSETTTNSIDTFKKIKAYLSQANSVNQGEHLFISFGIEGFYYIIGLDQVVTFFYFLL